MPKVLPDNTSQHHDGNRFPKASDYGLTKGYTDAANYHSPDIFTAEREAVFKQSWLCVGQLKDLPENGDYIRKQIPVLDASIIVVRGNDGTVRAFYNHCTHRGVPLIEEENGNDIPNASIAEAIVFAVYIPPQAPDPGQDFFIISLYSLLSIVPVTFSPHASNAETISNFLFLWQPESIVPPYKRIDGRFNLIIPIKAPGIFLSQPTTVIKPS